MLVLNNNFLATIVLALGFALAAASPVSASENPFVEAMRAFVDSLDGGSDDRDYVPTPYAREYWNKFSPNSMNPMNSMGPMEMPGMMPGMGPGMPMAPGGMMMPGANPWHYGQQLMPPANLQPPKKRIPLLEGAWEIHNGGLLIIKQGLARLYLSKTRYQDFYFKHDHKNIWMQPSEEEGIPLTYDFKLQSGRMIMRDENDKVLLLKRLKNPTK